MRYDRILVTGSNGLVGHAMREIMPTAMYVTRADYDLLCERDVQRMYNRLRPAMVIHLAAKVGGVLVHSKCPAEFLEENVIMNALMVKYARINDVGRFLGILSSCIFPDVMPHYPMVEEDIHAGAPPTTNFTYGIAKRVLAVHIDSYNKEFGTKYNYITPCNLYGAHDQTDENRSHYIPSLIKKIHIALKEGSDSILLYGDGTPLRQTLYVKDLANIIKIIVDRDITESFNVVSDDNFSIDEIAKIALEATNSQHLKILYDKTKPNGQYRKDLDNSKMKRLIPDVRFTPLSVGLKEYYDGYNL